VPPSPLTPKTARRVAQKAAIAMRGGVSSRHIESAEYHGEYGTYEYLYGLGWLDFIFLFRNAQIHN
jgi:hypothetical protein